MQLIKPENLKHFINEEIEGRSENDLVVCLNEIKMGILASSVIYSGSSTLIMNLISSFNVVNAEDSKTNKQNSNEIGGTEQKNETTWKR
jgi:hypothetical protein